MQCPFCKEEIQEGAIKCKHCGSMLTQAFIERSDPKTAKGCDTNTQIIRMSYEPIVSDYINCYDRSNRCSG
jgi:hypothetical protein